jgi:hypothetical protein
MDVKINSPPVVQKLDYEGVSALYLDVTLCCDDMVKILIRSIILRWAWRKD